MSQSVVIENAVKYYGEFQALKGVSLTVKPGEFFTLLGPSGCGKTTLLRMIAGFNSIEGGTIRFDNRVINDVPAYKRDIGMVFQNYAIFPHMTVAENVAYGLKAKKMQKQLIGPKVNEALSLVQIEKLKDRKPSDLSGGQQQRVALARAFVIEPKVLLMDEPLSNLDAKLRVQMRSVIRKLQRRLGITTLYVTHDQEEALAISDRIAVMKDGNIMQIDVPSEIYKHPQNKFVAGFIGVSNFVECEISSDSAGSADAVISKDFSVKVNLKAPFHGKATLSIRPEQLFFSKEGIPGKISYSTFLGDFIEYEIDIGNGQILQLNEYTKDTPNIRPDGEDVCVMFDSSKSGVYNGEGALITSWNLKEGGGD